MLIPPYKNMALLVLAYSFLPYLAMAEECVGLVTAGGGSDYWDSVKKGVLVAASEIGVSVSVRGASEEENIQGQEYVLKSFEKKRCIGLVVAPNSSERGAYASKLKQSGIPTVFIDRDVGGGRIAVIMTNNFNAGFQAAQMVVKNAPIDDSTFITIFRPGRKIIPTNQRVEGFLHGISTLSKIKVQIFDVGSTVGEARSKIKEIIDNTSSRVFFTPNQSTTLGLLATINYLKLERDIFHFGFDPNKTIRKAIKEAKIYGVVKQDPYLMGYMAVKTVYNAHLGLDIEENIYTPISFITKTKLSSDNN